MKYSGEPLDNQTWQTEWKTAPLAIVQLCEYENQTLESFAASRLYAKFDCPVASQNASLLGTAHDQDTGLFIARQHVFYELNYIDGFASPCTSLPKRQRRV